MLLAELESFYRQISAAPHGANYLRNRLKEFLHLYLLDFIYKHAQFRELIFYGGTCLRHCFGLPRLSEDLDFEYLHGEFPFRDMADEIEAHFRAVHHYRGLSIKLQKFRLYLKFPVLRQLGFAALDSSDFLHVKVEINSTSHPVGTFATEVQPLFIMQKTFYAKRYDLPTLMASKINALISRTWMRKSKIGEIQSDAKGRDYFDLLWYMQRKVVPNLAFTNFASPAALWEAVGARVNSVNPVSVRNDLIDFLEDPRGADDFVRNLPEAFKTLLKAISYN